MGTLEEGPALSGAYEPYIRMPAGPEGVVPPDHSATINPEGALLSAREAELLRTAQYLAGLEKISGAFWKLNGEGRTL